MTMFDDRLAISRSDEVNVVSFSGGKDSTAMLHLMLERNETVADVVFFDTGWEFPAMLEHIDKVEKKTGIKIKRLKPDKSFYYWMTKQKVKSKFPRPEIGVAAGDVYRIGNSWPSPMRRWCTRNKVYVINKYVSKHFENPVMCVGFASDEIHRAKKNSKYPKRYPLIEYGVTESDAIKYCKKLGYTWDGLYEIFKRVSCFCCPLQRIGELKKLRNHFPDLWEKMRKWDKEIPENRGFRGDKTVHDLELRFQAESLQQSLF